MSASASALDELDSSRVLHSLGALAIDLQDFITNLGKGRRPGRKERDGGSQKVGGGEERHSDR